MSEVVKSSLPAKCKKSNKITEECPICVRPFTEVERKKIACLRCHKEACMKCVEQYLLSVMEDTHCMFCRIGWSREFLDSVMTDQFRTRVLRRHRENILCEREKARLPETQALYETVQERMLRLQNDTKNLSEEYDALLEELNRITRETRGKLEANKQIRERKARQMYRLRRVLYGETDVMPEDSSFHEEAVKKVVRLLMPCPNMNCNGFMGSDHRCELCKTQICRNCHVIVNSEDKEDKEENHVCDESNVATVRRLKKDSKNCPGCGVLIYKIDGCDQMWCTVCHTAFSWKTGEKIIRGQIHNPHFYQWRRENGGLAPGAVGHDGCPVGITDIVALDTGVQRIMGKKASSELWDLHREIVILNELLERGVENAPDPNRALRIEYLKGRISEDYWKQELQLREKRENKRQEEMQVYEMYVTTMKDMFRRIARSTKKCELVNIQEEVSSLLEYVNDNLNKINKRYGSHKASLTASSALRLRLLRNCEAFTTVKPELV